MSTTKTTTTITHEFTPETMAQLARELEEAHASGGVGGGWASVATLLADAVRDATTEAIALTAIVVRRIDTLGDAFDAAIERLIRVRDLLASRHLSASAIDEARTESNLALLELQLAMRTAILEAVQDRELARLADRLVRPAESRLDPDKEPDRG